MNMITVRHRREGDTDIPPFSARNFRDLSLSAFIAAATPEGFADTPLPAAGSTLAQAIYLSGTFQTPALCSGLGRCGLCRIRFISAPPAPLAAEKAVLSHHDIDAGWRLACRHAPEAGMHVLVPAELAENSDLAKTPSLPAGRDEAESPRALAPAKLAVDLGTTSIHWRFVTDGGDGTSLPSGVLTNPQMGAGSDVVSRLAHAATAEGAQTLSRLVVGALRRIIGEGEAAGYATESLCVAANPSMAAILLGQDVTPLSRAPYALPDAGGTYARVPGLPPVYVPPHVSPFVGSDISAGYAATALNPGGNAPEFPFLLADLGTNGECILALSPEKAFAASLPMGPALEGINLAYGSEAVPGAVTEYLLTPYGLEPKVMGGTAPTGITATGYLSLLRILRVANLMGEDGLFIRPKDTLSERVAGAKRCGAENSIRLPGKMLLYASDVEEILKVKAAFTLAVSRLLAAAGIKASALKGIFLAGSLGTHAPVNALTGLGFLPSALADKIHFAGNTSLAGAALLLRDESVREKLAVWAKTVVSLDLANDPAFGEAFAAHMAFVWKN